MADDVVGAGIREILAQDNPVEDLPLGGGFRGGVLARPMPAPPPEPVLPMHIPPPPWSPRSEQFDVSQLRPPPEPPPAPLLPPGIPRPDWNLERAEREAIERERIERERTAALESETPPRRFGWRR